MKKKNVFSCFGIAVAAGFCFSHAQSALAKDYEIDSMHSSVGFVVRHLVSRVPGQFQNFDGHFSFDSAHPEKSKLTATVKVDSINTSNQKRDEHLRSPDFFDTKKFPTAKFVTTSFAPVEGKKYKMTGDLTLHGVTKPLTLEVEYLGDMLGPDGKNHAGFVAKGQLNRKDYGMNWNKVLDQGGAVLSDEIEMNLNIEAVEKSSH